MINVANLACKTIGVAGLSVAAYDAYAAAKHHSAAESASMAADTFESAIAAGRSNTNASHATNLMQNKIANLRLHAPIIPFIGKVKGFVSGFFNSLGDNFLPVTLSAVAIGAKGGMQKAGAWGLGLWAAYQFVKEGFGVGKTAPVDK